uniref:Uncharacterized protein n=1 Tax=Ditylenchus dipsaci TaxID=166011 RepID=A0A915EMR8_9BILA
MGAARLLAKTLLLGPNGCTDEMPIGLLDNYWSLLEFGVKIRRHAPYYGLTMVLPTLITALITLLVFWIEDLSLAIFLSVLNVLLQSFSGWALFQQLPPGNGQLPKIANLYAWNVLMTVKQDPRGDRCAPFQSLFQLQGLSFDPQSLNFGGENSGKQNESDTNHVIGHHQFNNPTGENSPTGSSDKLVLEMEPIGKEVNIRTERTEPEKSSGRNKSPTTSTQDTIVELDLGNRPVATHGEFSKDNESLMPHSSKNKHSGVEVANKELSKNQPNTSQHHDKGSKRYSQLEQELYVVRRLVFALFLCMFIVLMPLLLF